MPNRTTKYFKQICKILSKIYKHEICPEDVIHPILQESVAIAISALKSVCVWWGGGGEGGGGKSLLESSRHVKLNFLIYLDL